MSETENSKKTVEVTVDGGPPWPLKLTYDFNEIADAEPICGLNLLMAVGAPSRMSASQLRGLLYALLKTHNKDLTLVEAGDLMTADMRAVHSAVMECCGFDVVNPRDESFFLALERMALEQPVDLVEMLAKIKLPTVEPVVEPAVEPTE